MPPISGKQARQDRARARSERERESSGEEDEEDEEESGEEVSSESEELEARACNYKKGDLFLWGARNPAVYTITRASKKKSARVRAQQALDEYQFDQQPEDTEIVSFHRSAVLHLIAKYKERKALHDQQQRGAVQPQVARRAAVRPAGPASCQVTLRRPCQVTQKDRFVLGRRSVIPCQVTQKEAHGCARPCRARGAYMHKMSSVSYTHLTLPTIYSV